MFVKEEWLAKRLWNELNHVRNYVWIFYLHLPFLERELLFPFLIFGWFDFGFYLQLYVSIWRCPLLKVFHHHKDFPLDVPVEAALRIVPNVQEKRGKDIGIRPRYSSDPYCNLFIYICKAQNTCEVLRENQKTDLVYLKTACRAQITDVE